MALLMVRFGTAPSIITSPPFTASCPCLRFCLFVLFFSSVRQLLRDTSAVRLVCDCGSGVARLERQLVQPAVFSDHNPRFRRAFEHPFSEAGRSHPTASSKKEFVSHTLSQVCVPRHCSAGHPKTAHHCTTMKSKNSVRSKGDHWSDHKRDCKGGNKRTPQTRRGHHRGDHRRPRV